MFPAWLSRGRFSWGSGPKYAKVPKLPVLEVWLDWTESERVPSSALMDVRDVAIRRGLAVVTQPFFKPICDFIGAAVSARF